MTWSAADAVARGALYEAAVQLVTADRWAALVHSACLCHCTAAAEGRGPREADAGHAAYVRVCSFYGAAVSVSGEAGGALRPASELLAEPRAAEAMGCTVAFRAESAAAAAELVRPYVDSADEGDAGALWPLVERVVLRGPFAPLAGGVRVVDAPQHVKRAGPALVVPQLTALASWGWLSRLLAGLRALERSAEPLRAQWQASGAAFKRGPTEAQPGTALDFISQL